MLYTVVVYKRVSLSTIPPSPTIQKKTPHINQAKNHLRISNHSLILIGAVGDAEKREACVEADPEYDVTHHLVALDGGDAPDGDQWDLD